MNCHRTLPLALSLGLIIGHTSGRTSRVPRANEVQPVHIPLQVNDLQQYAVTLSMVLPINRDSPWETPLILTHRQSSGPRTQNLTFSLSTATGYTMVAGLDCNSCGVQSYDPSSSSSAHPTSGNQDVSLWSSPTSGNIVTEDCRLVRADGSPWAYENQTIIVANQSQTIVPSYGLSGVFGLGTNGRDGRFSESLMGNWLSQHPESTQFTYGLALNSPHSSSAQQGGELHLLAPDPNAFTGEITWKNMSTFGSDARDSDWYIEMDSWSFQSARSGQLRQNNLRAVMDPFLAPMRFPSQHARAIFSTVPGAKSSNLTTPGAITWDVPCDSKMMLTFSYGGFTVSMHEGMLIRKVTDRCVSVIEEWVNSSTDIYALGSTFISAVYIVFSASGPSEGTVGIASRAEKGNSNISTGGIIGIVFGGLALAITVATAAVLAYRWRSRRSTTKGNTSETGPIATPYMGYTVAGDPFEATTFMLTPASPPPTGNSLGLTSPSSHHGSPLVSNSLDSPPPYIGEASSSSSNLPIRAHIVTVGPPPVRDRKSRVPNGLTTANGSELET